MRRAVAAVAALVAVGLAGPAQAAAEAGHAPNWFLLLLQVGNFALLVFLLYRFARKPVLDYLQQRSQTVRGTLDDAETRLRDAETELAALRQRLDGFDGEARATLARASEQAEIEREHHLERARAASERLREDARRVAQREIERARLELRAEAAELATELAAELLREGVTPDDDRRLVREFVERVERSA